jgi:hypothetical protein
MRIIPLPPAHKLRRNDLQKAKVLLRIRYSPCLPRHRQELDEAQRSNGDSRSLAPAMRTSNE